MTNIMTNLELSESIKNYIKELFDNDIKLVLEENNKIINELKITVNNIEENISNVNTINKDFPKERYNTFAKSCNSNLYTKYPGATYSGLLLGTMCCL